MTRFHLIAGSVALFAFAGVNAGPCRPSSVSTTTGLATTVTTPIDETTALSTHVTETLSTDSLSVTSAAGTATTTEIGGTTTTTTDIETSAPTVTATTTADMTTTAIATSSAPPMEELDPEPRGSCADLNQPYKARNGATFDITCGKQMYFDILFDTIFTNTFSDCADACAEHHSCTGVSYTKSERKCELFDEAFLDSPNTDKDIATLRSRPE